MQSVEIICGVGRVTETFRAPALKPPQVRAIESIQRQLEFSHAMVNADCQMRPDALGVFRLLWADIEGSVFVSKIGRAGEVATVKSGASVCVR